MSLDLTKLAEKLSPRAQSLATDIGVVAGIEPTSQIREWLLDALMDAYIEGRVAGIEEVLKPHPMLPTEVTSQAKLPVRYDPSPLTDS